MVWRQDFAAAALCVLSATGWAQVEKASAMTIETVHNDSSSLVVSGTIGTAGFTADCFVTRRPDTTHPNGTRLTRFQISDSLTLRAGSDYVQVLGSMDGPSLRRRDPQKPSSHLLVTTFNESWGNTLTWSQPMEGGSIRFKYYGPDRDAPLIQFNAEEVKRLVSDKEHICAQAVRRTNAGETFREPPSIREAEERIERTQALRRTLRDIAARTFAPN